MPPEEAEKDWMHALAISYQTPESILRLAQREFAQPIEIRRPHPYYENWKPELYGSAFYETLYFGHTFQLGSLAKGTGGDWQGFGLHLRQGADIDDLAVEGRGSHQIAQHRNLMIWFGETSPQITFPEGQVETRQNITFVATEYTWLALHRLERGFALEVGEQATHGSFKQFKRAILERSRLTLDANKIEYRGSQGHTVALGPQESGLPEV